MPTQRLEKVQLDLFQLGPIRRTDVNCRDAQRTATKDFGQDLDARDGVVVLVGVFVGTKLHLCENVVIAVIVRL